MTELVAAAMEQPHPTLQLKRVLEKIVAEESAA